MLSLVHSNVAAVEGAWPVMGFTSHQQMHGEPSGRIAGCCSHFSRRHYGDRSAPRRCHSHTAEIAPKWASGSTWFGWVFTESAGLSSCVLVTSLPRPRRAKWGDVPRGMRSVDTPPPTPADDAPPAGGPWQEPNLPRLSLTKCDHQTKCDQQVTGYITLRPWASTGAGNMRNSVPTNRTPSTLRT
jgi:hypothetical protein